MLWIKAFHIIAMVAWFAGLFYLPRLYVYHTEANDPISNQRFKIMEYRLYYFIMTPAALATLVFGFMLLSQAREYYLHAFWMQAKLLCVLLLCLFHLACGLLLKRFKEGKNQYSTIFYRFFNEFPTLMLISIILLAEFQPG